MKTKIDVSFQNLPSLDVSTNTALTVLSCYSNQLPSLDVSKNTALTELNCSKNHLPSLDVSTNTALTNLWCSKNHLPSLDVSTNTALTELNCSNNPLPSLDVSNNTALTYLDCYNNQLPSLDVSANTALTYLDCGGNQLPSLDVSANTALTWLYCSNNQLPSLDVSGATALAHLNCSSNHLTRLPKLPDSLRVLYCSNNPFEEPISQDVIKKFNLDESKLYTADRIEIFKSYEWQKAFLKKSLKRYNDIHSWILPKIKEEFETFPSYEIKTITIPEEKADIANAAAHQILTPYCCPVCRGNGLVPNGFYRQTSGDWATDSIVPETCRSCKGTGIVWT